MAKQKTTNSESSAEIPDDKPSLKKRWLKIKPTRRNIDRRQRAILRHARKFLVQRWDNLRTSRREVISWLLLVAVLVAIGSLQTVLYARCQETIAAADGGTYAEGVVDKIVTINPLYVTTDGERAASGLVYSGLLRLDETGHLRPELAMSYSVSQDGKTYSVKLRDHVKWSDGQTFSADDVVLTVELMKNPSVGSALQSSWRNIEVKKISDLEVAFTLKNALASFPFALNFGILPAHILKDVKPADVQSTFSNDPTKMVGTGPFVYRSGGTVGNQTEFKFAANRRYFRGAPRLAALAIRTYATSDDLLKGFQNNEVNVAAGLDEREAAQSLDIPDANLIQTSLGDGVFALFNNSGTVANDPVIREALRLGADRSTVRAAATSKSKLDIVSALETPLTPGLVAGVDQLKQPDYDFKAAGEKLDAAGWKLNSSDKRFKDNQPLTLNVVTVDGADYESAAQSLAEQWRKLGIEVEFTAASPSNIQQNFVIPRAYDVLVYQLHIGADPDVFAYWASSQATARGLNFANYKSTLSDLSLTNARTQTDSSRRAARYTDFAKRWLADAPAIALYRPNYYYLTADTVRSLNGANPLLDESSRFAEVQDFTVNVSKFKTTP
jgi:peptide/nickel transport system substrate-binding protein